MGGKGTCLGSEKIGGKKKTSKRNTGHTVSRRAAIKLTQIEKNVFESIVQ